MRRPVWRLFVLHRNIQATRGVHVTFTGDQTLESKNNLRGNNAYRRDTVAQLDLLLKMDKIIIVGFSVIQTGLACQRYCIKLRNITDEHLPPFKVSVKTAEEDTINQKTETRTKLDFTRNKKGFDQ